MPSLLFRVGLLLPNARDWFDVLGRVVGQQKSNSAHEIRVGGCWCCCYCCNDHVNDDNGNKGEVNVSSNEIARITAIIRSGEGGDSLIDWLFVT